MPRFIAIDADHPMLLHVAVGNVSRGSLKIEKAITVPQDQPLNWNNATETGKRLKEALKAARVGPAPVLMSVGRERLILKEIKYPPVEASEEPNVVRFQVSRELTEAAEDMVIDYAPSLNNDTASERKALAVVLRKETLKTYQALCTAAGLKLESITPRPFGSIAAIERAISLGAVNPVDANGSIAVLTRGEKWGELIIARAGEVVLARTLAGPSLNTETALLGEIRRNLTVYAGQSPSPVQALYVAETESPGSWSGRIRMGVSVPVEAFDPLTGAQSLSPPEHRAAFAGPVGLLVLQSRNAKLPINFVSPREPVIPRDPTKRLITLLAPILLFVLLASFGYGFSVKMEKDRQIAALMERKTFLDRELQDSEEDEKRIKALDDWRSKNINWLDELYDLTARIPDISGTQIIKFTGIPREPEKNAKIKYVASMEMVINTESATFVDQIMSEMNRDLFYKVNPKEARGNTGINTGRLNQQFSLRTEIVQRKPKEYIRILNVAPPARKTGGDERKGPPDGFDPFASGFPGGQ